MRLEGTSSNADAPLVPVLDFNCVQSTFTQQLDHFNATEQRTWQQVYWVCDDAFPKAKQEQVRTGLVTVGVCTCISNSATP
jgi:hypothetical protein